jgi:hypothetical protein
MSDLSATLTVRWTPPTKNEHLVNGYQVLVVNVDTGAKDVVNVPECEYVHRITDVADSFQPIAISVRAVAPQGVGNYTHPHTVTPQFFKDLSLSERNIALLLATPDARPVAAEQMPSQMEQATGNDTSPTEVRIDRRIRLELPDNTAEGR